VVSRLTEDASCLTYRAKCRARLASARSVERRRQETSPLCANGDEAATLTVGAGLLGPWKEPPIVHLLPRPRRRRLSAS
jgi:hypothetical protein